MRCAFRVVAGALVGLVALVGPSGDATAEVRGSCEGTAAFATGTDANGPFTVDARAVGAETVIVPRQDTVEWTGSVVASPGDYSGSIGVDLPWPLGAIDLASWEGTTERTGTSGFKDYDLPAVVPSGVDLRVVATHTDQVTECSGFVNARIEGSPFDSPVAPLALVLTGVVGLGFVAVVLPLFRSGPP